MHASSPAVWARSAARWGLVAGVATLALLIACESNKGAAKKPDKPSTPMRWIDSTPQKVAKGKAAFGACMGCHGNDAGGRVGIGPRLASESFLAAASDDFLVENIKEGRAGTTMVPWKSSYSDDQVQAVVAYLRSLEAVGPADLNEAPLKGDPAKGAEDFRTICAACHGRNGGGYQETSNGTGIGRKVFLDKASNGFMRHIIEAGKSHTAMKGFADDAPAAVANLTPQQIDNIIAYLRKNAW